MLIEVLMSQKCHEDTKLFLGQTLNTKRFNRTIVIQHFCIFNDLRQSFIRNGS